MVRGNRDRAAFDLLRQLALGLSSYRLFPGDLEQGAFVAAVERIRDTAELALAAGAVHLDLRAGVFHGPDGDALQDDHIDRIARAAFERGVEHVHVRAVPTLEELGALFEVLSLPESDVLAVAGGVDGLARARGVTALTFGAIEPEAGEEGDPLLDEMTAAQLDVWSTVLDPSQFIASAVGSVEGLSATGRADAVYRRIKEVEAALPRSFTSGSDFLDSIERLIGDLPTDLRREFAALAMARASSDGLAERYLNHMTDAELAQLVDLVAGGGADPFDLARRLQQVVGRQTSFVDLVDAMFGQSLPTSRELSDQTRPTVAALASDGNSLLKPTVVDLLSKRILDEAEADAASIRRAFPVETAERRSVALAAFRDYVRLEDHADAFEAAVRSWRLALRDQLANRDVAAVGVLVDAIDSGALVGTKRETVLAATRDVLDAELVTEMAQWARDDGDLDEVRDLLAVFDEAAVESLLDALAGEEDRGRRAVMLGMVTELGQGHGELVANRLADDRWYVVRNAVTILGRVGGAGALTGLVRAAGHPDPTVRREVVRSLVSASGSDAVPYLARLGADRDDAVARAAIGALGAMTSTEAAAALAGIAREDAHLDRRRRAIDVLSASTAPNAGELLRSLSARQSSPRLPWSLRRYVRRQIRSGVRS